MHAWKENESYHLYCHQYAYAVLYTCCKIPPPLRQISSSPLLSRVSAFEDWPGNSFVVIQFVHPHPCLLLGVHHRDSRSPTRHCWIYPPWWFPNYPCPPYPWGTARPERFWSRNKPLCFDWTPIQLWRPRSGTAPRTRCTDEPLCRHLGRIRIEITENGLEIQRAHRLFLGKMCWNGLRLLRLQTQ